MALDSSALSPEFIAIIGAAVALAGLILHGRRATHRDVGDLRRDVADLRERMAKLEDAMGILGGLFMDRERGAPREASTSS